MLQCREKNLSIVSFVSTFCLKWPHLHMYCFSVEWGGVAGVVWSPIRHNTLCSSLCQRIVFSCLETYSKANFPHGTWGAMCLSLCMGVKETKQRLALETATCFHWERRMESWELDRNWIVMIHILLSLIHLCMKTLVSHNVLTCVGDLADILYLLLSRSCTNLFWNAICL